ncbi:hypothetical protein IWQ62_002385, partial [Dispira parvispora]
MFSSLKKTTLLGALTFAALWVNTSAYFYSTSPVADTNWLPGQEVNVVWMPQLENGEVAPAADATYTVSLMTGVDDPQTFIKVITPEPLSVSTTSFTFKVPENLNPGLYFLKYTCGNLLNWSTRFHVAGGTATNPPLPSDIATETSSATETQTSTDPAATTSTESTTSPSTTTTTSTESTTSPSTTSTTSPTKCLPKPTSTPTTTPPAKCRPHYAR